jgi:hypothetical protein
MTDAEVFLRFGLERRHHLISISVRAAARSILFDWSGRGEICRID